jgi:tRNA(adenine34) deaminase
MENIDFLNLAYEQAEIAYEQKEIPCGAVIVYNDEVICVAHNLSQKTKDPTAHAELLALQMAFSQLKNKNLSGCKIYITLEPCLMCLGAIINSHIKEIYFSALDPVKGAFTHYGVSPAIDKLEIHYIKDNRCEDILTQFFKDIRTN